MSPIVFGVQLTNTVCSSNPISRVQTDGWNSVGDKDGVPVWAANSLAFQAGSRYKVSSFKVCIFPPLYLCARLGETFGRE